MQSKSIKKKLNRKDFLFQDGWFQTKIKKPKQLVMQQFQISDCEQCNIFLYDSNACVYVDSCKYCNIFIGPSQSSIFVRDCSYVNIVSISQQFRVRDSFNCKFAIFCQSQPIIQSSNNIVFLCYPGDFVYKQMKQQMKQAKLNEWNNNWFDIYDFTPNKFNGINHQLSSYEKEFVGLKELFFKNMKENQIEMSRESFIPTIQGKVNIQTGQSYGLDQIIFLAITPSIQASQIVSLILQSRSLPKLPSQVYKIFEQLKPSKDMQILFLKIRKADQSRWRTCDKLIKCIKEQDQKQIIQNIIFAPFKDQH